MLFLLRVMVSNGAGVAMAMLIPVSTLSMRYPVEVNVSTVKEDTGSVDTGFVNID